MYVGIGPGYYWALSSAAAGAIWAGRRLFRSGAVNSSKPLSVFSPVPFGGDRFAAGGCSSWSCAFFSGMGLTQQEDFHMGGDVCQDLQDSRGLALVERETNLQTSPQCIELCVKVC